MLITLQKDLGTSFSKDPLGFFQDLRTNDFPISTGWSDIDSVLYGGPIKGNLVFFMGLPGAGKSLFLQNVSLNMIQEGYNVLYISLELKEALVKQRMYAMLAEAGTKQMYNNYEESAEKLNIIFKKEKYGDLRIKKMPDAGTTTNDIRAYAKEYTIQTGNKIDFIVVDYEDLMSPNDKSIDIANAFVKDKVVCTELRALASELDCIVYLASQINRSGNQEQEFDMSHVAGGISKLNTCDIMMAIFTTTAMRQKGEYEIQFLKTRTSSGVGNKVKLKYNNETMRISNGENSVNKNFNSSQSLVDAIKAKSSNDIRNINS